MISDNEIITEIAEKGFAALKEKYENEIDDWEEIAGELYDFSILIARHTYRLGTGKGTDGTRIALELEKAAIRMVLAQGLTRIETTIGEVLEKALDVALSFTEAAAEGVGRGIMAELKNRNY